MPQKSNFPENKLVLFFLGPWFLLLIKLNGNYNYNYRRSTLAGQSSKEFGAKLVLMVLGTLFYVGCLFIFVYLS